MRAILLLFVGLVAAAPATAQDDVPTPDRSAEKMARTLSNPAVQEGIAAILGEVANTVLDTRIGPLSHYVDPQDDVRPDDTLGSLIKRDDPAFAQHLHDKARGAVAAAGAMAGDAAKMSGELNATADRLRQMLKAVRSTARAESSHDE